METINKELNTEIILEYSKSQKLILKENGLYHHSKYAPEKEGVKLIESIPQETNTIAFYGFGLGYALFEAVCHFSDKEIILIEPSISFFMLALHCLDWEPVFSHEKLVIFLQTDITTITQYIENKLNAAYFVDLKISQQHNSVYFSQLKELIKRTEQKNQINENTYHAYYKRWIKNILQNFSEHQNCSSLQPFENKAKNQNACIIAAGPTLDAILPLLPEIQKKAVLICVDTALRACLRQGIEPDFIVLSDSQYWNSRHITDLEAPNAILVTEILSYPSVFRFKCKEKVLISSWNPLGKYLEKDFQNHVFLSPGGTVASTAWELARFLGCTQIYLAGLDLGFPHKKTHTKGSLFEEKTFYLSSRFCPSEQLLTNVLYGQQTFYRKNFVQQKILTDHRMTMYCWWFESICEKYPNIKTFTFSQEGLFIPNIVYENPLIFCKNTTEISKDFTDFPFNQKQNKTRVSAILENFYRQISELLQKTQTTFTTKKNNWQEIIQNKELIHIAQLIFPSKKEIKNLSNEKNWNETQTILFLLGENCKNILKKS